MSKAVQIDSKDNAVKIILDGNEIHDVISYALSENPHEVPTLTLKIAIMGEISDDTEPMKFYRCPCGQTQHYAYARYCGYCGRKLEEAASTASSTEPHL